MDFPLLPFCNPFEQSTIAPEAVRAQLGRILSSALFGRARRSAELLDYLVSRHLDRPHETIKEFMVGIDVYRRDVRTYRPDVDPIVRVQAGRLRRRLDDYYAGHGRGDPVRIRVPRRGYVPEVTRQQCDAPGHARVLLLPVVPGSAGEATIFAAGLAAELRHRLHRDLGNRLIDGKPGFIVPDTGTAPAYVLEGSVRADGVVIRTQLAMTAVREGTIVWSEQADVGAGPAIARQEQLAQLCCSAVLARLG
jgi:TolB-like protein